MKELIEWTREDTTVAGYNILRNKKKEQKSPPMFKI